jgi:hypothetical protein
MYKFHNCLLPLNFNDYFASLPKPRTNFGLFTIRYRGVKVWNALSDFDKRLSFTQFKRKLKANFVDSY